MPADDWGIKEPKPRMYKRTKYKISKEESSEKLKTAGKFLDGADQTQNFANSLKGNSEDMRPVGLASNTRKSKSSRTPSTKEYITKRNKELYG